MKPHTLTERAFAERREKDWEELGVLTARAEGRGPKTLAAEDLVRFVPLYRSICADLAAAEAARYSAPLVDSLRGLTAAAHSVVYGRVARRRGRERGGLRSAWLHAFPRAVRRKWRPMLLAAGLFFVPFALGLVLSIREPSFAFRIVPEAMLRPLAEAYRKGFAAGREPGEGVLMAGFYVYNNVGIALRCFALGLTGGLGSAFYLVQNGLSIGAILGYVASQGGGAGENIGVFILGHGSLELAAIVLAGGAGLSIGWAIVAPGNLTRLRSLQKTAREILVIVGGAAVMLAMAALIEAFWSASSLGASTKVAVGSTLFLLLCAYVLLGGRGAEPGAEPPAEAAE